MIDKKNTFSYNLVDFAQFLLGTNLILSTVPLTTVLSRTKFVYLRQTIRICYALVMTENLSKQQLFHLSADRPLPQVALKTIKTISDNIT